jgi:hypothetical protein
LTFRWNLVCLHLQGFENSRAETGTQSENRTFNLTVQFFKSVAEGGTEQQLKYFYGTKIPLMMGFRNFFNDDFV